MASLVALWLGIFTSSVAILTTCFKLISKLNKTAFEIKQAGINIKELVSEDQMIRMRLDKIDIFLIRKFDDYDPYK